MSRRKSVKLNLQFVNPKIKQVCRSNVVFCEKMGRPNQKTWVTDWNRKDKDGNPAPKNLPSPEEAARMCAILQVTPEEILTEPEDIELVRSLIDGQKENADPQKGTGTDTAEKLTDMEKKVLNLFHQIPESEWDNMLLAVEVALRNRGLLE